MPLTENEIKRIDGNKIGLDWLAECASVYSDIALKMNWHAHAEDEVICCLKGEMQYEFEKHPHRTLHAGEFIVIPSGTVHRLSSGIDAPSRRVSFLIRRSFTGTCRSVFSAADLKSVCRLLLSRRFRPLPYPPELRSGLLRIGHYLHSDRRRLAAHEQCELRHLCESVLFGCTADESRRRPRPEVLLMDEALAWMERNYAAHVSLAPLIEHMGYGRSRFFQLFKKKTGLPPNEYLIRLRIRKSRELLTRTDLSIAEIAERTGFSDAAFFSRTFKRLVGVPPNGSRKNRKRHIQPAL